MLTATLGRPAKAPRRARILAPASSTPAWLRTVVVSAAAASAAIALAGAVTVSVRSHALASARDTSEPLVVDAQTVVVDLSDANTTVAGGFLAPRVVPQAASARFSADMAHAAAALLAAGQRAGSSPQVTSLEQKLSTGLPVYSGLVATAEADHRNSQPVGAAYLAEANHLMASSLSPAALDLYTLEQRRLAADSRRASAWGGEAAALALVAVLLAILGHLQLGAIRRFRRLLNPGALVATLSLAALAVWLVVALAAQGAAVARAAHVGSAPLDVLTQARILDGQARADDQLTLVTRDSDPSYQADYKSVGARLTSLLQGPRHGWTPAETTEIDQASVRWDDYSLAHQKVRAEDAGGDQAAAIADDGGTSAGAAAQLDGVLAAGVDGAVAAFNSSARAAASDLSGLLIGVLVLMAIAVAGVVAGVRPRLKEYR